MLAEPTPTPPEPPSRGQDAALQRPSAVACPVLGLPPLQDDTYGWVGYESAHPGAWLTAPQGDAASAGEPLPPAPDCTR